MPRPILRRAGLGALTITSVLLVTAAPAAAHVTTVDSTAPADGFTTVELQIPHGCDGQPTNVVSVSLRDDISSVKAQAIPGWEVTYERQPLEEPIELHGEQIDEYVAVVTWTATADPLPDDQFMRFGISMKMPDRPDERILLPTVQTCPDGSEEAWIEEDPDAEYPAPAVELVEAASGHGDAEAEAEAEDTGAGADHDEAEDDGAEDADEGEAAGADAEADEAVDVATPEPIADDDGGSDAVARVLAGGAAVLAAVALFVGWRRQSA